MKKAGWWKKGVAAGLLYKGARFVARKVWPLVEKRLAAKNRKRFERFVGRVRRKPARA
jgi:hypothetical protein